MDGPSESRGAPAPLADRLGGGCLLIAGACALLAAVGLPLGYKMAESSNIGLLALAMVVLVGAGVGLLLLGRSVMRHQ